MENQIIYGVDLSKEITPIMVRDAIIVCFKMANKEILDAMDQYRKWPSEQEREKFKNFQIEAIIRSAFKETADNFESPSKTGLVKVIDYLAQLVSPFRDPEIIQKHYNEIKQLIEKLEG